MEQINVSKLSVLDYLKTGAKSPFVIPEYQRPYNWTEDQVRTLFDDIWEFSSHQKDDQEEYFLGCIVSIENNGCQEIIDGQQRITTLFLLLRAIYTHLSSATVQTERTAHFIGQIGPAIWDNDKYTGSLDMTKTHLVSKVIKNEGNEILHKILETGSSDEAATDNYSKNYRLLQQLYAEKAAYESYVIFDFIISVIHKTIILRINADEQDTALRIFNTLNDRGMPLDDADIFKAKLYGHQATKEEKDDFIQKWKDLEELAASAHISVQTLFNYYMFYHRANEGDKKSTTPGVRNYFMKSFPDLLYQPLLMEELNDICLLWKYANNLGAELDEKESQEWKKDDGIACAFDILRVYPNEFWKYPVTTFYLKHHHEEEFAANFLRFLRRLIAELVIRLCLYPTLNYVKGDIMKLNAEAIGSNHPKFDFRPFDDQDLKRIPNTLKTPTRGAIRMLLSMMAYSAQDTLLRKPTEKDWEIEHIFPRSWTGYLNLPADFVKSRIEQIGNLLPFEKSLNIKASNYFFNKKKSEYSESEIVITKNFSSLEQSDWTLEDIENRSDEMVNTILEMVDEWKQRYDEN